MATNYLRIANTHFFDKSAFEFWAAVFKTCTSFSSCVSSVDLGATLQPKYACQPWDHFRSLINK